MIKKLAILSISLYFFGCGSSENEQQSDKKETSGKSVYLPKGFHAVVNHGDENAPVSLIKVDTLYHLYYTTGTDQLGHISSTNLLDWLYETPLELAGQYAYIATNRNVESISWLKFEMDESKVMLASSPDGSSWNEASMIINDANGVNPTVSWSNNLELWILTLTSQDQIEIFTSENLQAWNKGEAIPNDIASQKSQLTQIGNDYYLFTQGNGSSYRKGSFDGISFISEMEADLSQPSFTILADQTSILITGTEKSDLEKAPTFGTPLEIVVEDGMLLQKPISQIERTFSSKRRGKVSNLIAKGPSWYTFTIEENFNRLDIELSDGPSRAVITVNRESGLLEIDRSEASIGSNDLLSQPIDIYGKPTKVDLILGYNIVDISFNDGSHFSSFIVKPFSFFSNVSIKLDREDHDPKGVLNSIGI